MRRNRGFSLIELMAVLCILGILLAITVPAARMFYGGNPNDRGVRFLFATLRAAKIYATTHNVSCAVVFNMRNVQDSRTGENVRVLDGVMLARELKRAELLRRGIRRPRKITGETSIFARIEADVGRFNLLPGKTCILNEVFSLGYHQVQATNPDTGELEYSYPEGPDGPAVPIMITVREFTSSTGMQAVRVIENDWPNLMTATDLFINPELEEIFLTEMPAFVFMPDGRVRVADSFAKQRIMLRVGLRPDEPVEVRFLEDVELVSTVFLYHGTGRIKVVNP